MGNRAAAKMLIDRLEEEHGEEERKIINGSN
jgi:hypothetical protein